MSQYVWGDEATQFFFALTPDVVLDAVEAVGIRTTGRCIQLNSMENRVYEVEREISDYNVKSVSDRFLVIKFYRPGRWSEKQIRDEHLFMQDLLEAEVPVVAPMKFNGETLFQLKDAKIFYTLFPKMGGRVPDEMNEEQLQIMGRMLARLHNVGVMRKSHYRLELTPQNFAEKNMNFLHQKNFIPSHQKELFLQVTQELMTLISPHFDFGKFHRIHGDCHVGNLIWRAEEGPYFIDFDDMLVGPAIQDLWLVVPGNDNYAKQDRMILIEAYDSMRSFDMKSLKLIEPLRALRYIHFAAWIAKRWEDQAFKTAFAHFENGHYFDILLNDLRQQIQLIKEENNPVTYW